MEPLTVLMTEFYPKDNSSENHTQDYDLVNNKDVGTPVLRRGENFYFAIRFDRPFDDDADVVRTRFSIGPRPSVGKGTRVILPILVHNDELPQDNRWGLILDRKEGNSVILRAHIPYTAQVGIWNCSIQTNISGMRDKRNDYKCEVDIYVLFNPWCSDDPVYMEKEEERQEYVLNPTGKIWCGTFRQPRGKPWIFGQFDDVVLPAAVFLLEKSNLSHSDRGSPTLVARAISAVINSNDDDGLLVGRWDGDYSDGTSPFAWTGSTAILDQYLMRGGEPVKYGQCWVFSAATVTVCRTLGIPCRSVTNYVSAHDTNKSLTVDKYFDVFGDLIENGPDGDCNDSCWNFHVWNDVWMARPDLPPGYGGWQIVDSTPQELSGGFFCCGPASVEAVKRGEIGYMFDTPFAFSEVNADICHFQEDENSDWGFSRLAINQYHVGRKILTKQMGPTDTQGDSDMSDVTSEYKNSEGSEEERLAVFNAIRGVPRAQQYYDIPTNTTDDVFFDLVNIEAVPIGRSFDVVVTIENRSDEIRNISAMLSASSIFYTGAASQPIKKAQGTFAVKAGESEVLRIHVTPEEYLDKLVDHNLVKIYALANVQETKQTWSEEDDFALTAPSMNIQLKTEPRVELECVANFSFQNPLDQPLESCTYTVQGPGLKKPKTSELGNVQPGELVVFEEVLVPHKQGSASIVATFNSRQLHGVGGSLNVSVE